MRRPVPHSNTQTPATTPKRRCAVYTRKSTDEGLDMEYNSLEAQRDAGLAYIASQRLPVNIVDQYPGRYTRHIYT